MNPISIIQEFEDSRSGIRGQAMTFDAGALRAVLEKQSLTIATAYGEARARDGLYAGEDPMPPSVSIPFAWVGQATILLVHSSMADEVVAMEFHEEYLRVHQDLRGTVERGPSGMDLIGSMNVVPGGIIEAMWLEQSPWDGSYANIDEVPELQTSLYNLLFVLREEGVLLPTTTVIWEYMYRWTVDAAIAWGKTTQEEFDQVVAEHGGGARGRAAAEELLEDWLDQDSEFMEDHLGDAAGLLELLQHGPVSCPLGYCIRPLEAGPGGWYFQSAHQPPG